MRIVSLGSRTLDYPMIEAVLDRRVGDANCRERPGQGGSGRYASIGRSRVCMVGPSVDSAVMV